MAPQSSLTTWLTAQEVAAGTGLAIGSVYRLASINRWRKRDHHRPARYSADDVHATLDTRKIEAA